MPKLAWVTWPVAISWLAIVSAMSTGMAKPSPMLPPLEPGTAAPAEGIPTSCPSQLTIAPPLLPGLIAASVWMASASSALWDVPPPGTSTVRASALTMPLVTLLDSPSGAPTTTTGWPTWRSAEDPSAMTWGDWASGALITARSVNGSRPTKVAGTRWPSLSITSMLAPLAAFSTTWLFVSM